MGESDIIGMGGALAGIMLVYMVVYCALMVFTIVCQWKMFEKAYKPGWTCLIPIYSTYQQFDIAYGDGWKCLWLLVPFVNIYFAVNYSFKLSRAFGKGTAFGLGLLFLSPIFNAIVAFSKDIHYVGPYEN